MNDVLARLHRVDWRALGLGDFGRPGNYFARQIHRWAQQYRASETEKIEAYGRREGRPPIPDSDFYMAFAMFRLSAIAQGIMGRVFAGTANDLYARERGARARPLAESGWRLVEARAG